MKPKPGRVSRADLSVLPGLMGARRLQPPDDLDADASRVFRDIVASNPESHFVASDGPLLAVYCEALVITRRSAAKIGKDPAALATWEKASRLLAQLASKLRLCPSSRSDPKTVARHSGDYQPSYYDLMRMRDEQSR